jgi:hypothetical protein
MTGAARTSGVNAPDRPRRQQGPIYLIRLRGQPGSDVEHRLRAFLKLAWRRFGLRCVDIKQETQDVDDVCHE